MVTLLIFAARKDGLTTSEYKDYYESVHVPLIESLLGEHFPTSLERQYLVKEAPEGAESSPISGEGFQYDSIAKLTFRDEEHFGKFLGLWKIESVVAALTEDAQQFMKEGSLKAVTVGSVCQTLAENLKL